MNDSRRAGLVLTGALALAVLVAGVSAVHWAARYRLGTSWDESDYVNQMVRLDQDAHARGLSHAVRQVRWTDNIRPPAYRLAALPVTYLLGADPRVLRALSLAALLLTGGLVYGAARLVSARPVAGVASASLVLSYAPLWASAHFGTEYVIYPATAGVIYGLMWWASGPRGRGGVLPWVGVVAALALGGLSKTSFAPLVAPAYLVFLAAGRRAGVPARVLWAAAGAAVAAALLIAPWWIVNAGSALAYARYASGFVRHDFPWLSEAFWHLLGPPVTVLGLGLLGFVAARWRAVRGAMVSGSMLALVMCLVGAVSLLVVHALGANHNMRLASPALIPLALAGAVLAQASAAFEDRRARVAVGLLVLLQGGYVAREFSRARIEQWDWSALRSLCAQRGLRYPDIRYLGNGIAFNPAAIAYAWVVRDDSVRVKWMWRYEEGPIGWDRIVASADSADVVVTAPGYRGAVLENDQLDNQHNGELAARLEADGRFAPPVELRMGSSATPVLAFLRRGDGTAPPPRDGGGR